MLKKVLVANRGEIACRIIRTLDRMGIASVAVYSEADRTAPHVAMAGEAVCIGAAPVAESYLQMERILDAAQSTGAEAVHPGYGLLSENARFAEACAAAGISFIGPTIGQLIAFGLKHEARRLVEESGGPLLPGTGILSGVEEALAKAEHIGYPVMLKSTAGGGGIGMHVCRSAFELQEAYARVERLSQSHFGQAGLFLEKFITDARHLEVQIFGDGRGKVVSLGVRDCSSQRRNQKVLEETPPPNVPDHVLTGIQEAALRLAGSVAYQSAGTVEFIYDDRAQAFHFLEVNTRLQVEHGVTELVTGVDLVEWMVALAGGKDVLAGQPDILPQRGHSIQARLYSENPYKDFQPSSGILTHVEWPEGIRLDGWVSAGTEVTPYYDPMLAKVQVLAEDRPAAVAALQAALEATRLDGIETNLPYLRSIVRSETFTTGRMLTRTLKDHTCEQNSFEVLRAGTMTTIQDYPGRLGYWDVGIPPSGPMDALSFRMGNRLLGNAEEAAGMEITATGPRLHFHAPAMLVLTGAHADLTLNGVTLSHATPFQVAAGDILDIGKLLGPGVRAYLCIKGGIDVPHYLGSRATFTLGQFGGHAGRALRTGDFIHYLPSNDTELPLHPGLPTRMLPAMGSSWEIGVLYGPHGAPDFFTTDDIQTFFSTSWEVHYNSARTGVRLIGPKPKWARRDGGEAGLHPSNIHDNAYAIGAIDFTGDMPVILGPDGPSLGGFVCPATVVQAELWKLGQLRPGDHVRFRCLTPSQAAELRAAQDLFLESLNTLASDLPDNLPAPLQPSLPHHAPDPAEAILSDSGTGGDRLVIRQSGDANVLAEIGPMQLDFRLRFHIHVLYEALMGTKPDGILDLTPGIRSLQAHFDPAVISATQVCSWIVTTNGNLPPLEDVAVPSRIVHLPLSWDDPSTREAIQRYMSSVRPDAPWCPDNIEFIRRINGLESREDVYRTLFDASYVVLGLGDVYLGAPVATPLDPRHRLVTTKYNPARTWTPENAVGIGGAYLCVYGMEGPGGYQFVGRTIQMWNRHRETAVFEPGRPWLLRFFDQIRFYPVSTGELADLRIDFPLGRFIPKIEPTTLRLADYLKFLHQNSDSIETFKQRQQAAFEAERARWDAAGIAAYVDEEAAAAEPEAGALPENSQPLESPVAGSVWKILIDKEGQRVEHGQTLAIIESMKMEVKVDAHASGIVTRVLCREGQGITPGKVLFAIEELAN